MVMKRAVVVLCALCMLIAMVGCGSDADSSQSAPETDTETRAIGVIDVEKTTDIENSSLTEPATPLPTSEPTENVTPEQTETSTPEPQVEKMVATEKVNVREQPNTDCNVLGKLTGGDSISVYETMSDGWSRVDYNGTEGYVKTEFLTSEKDYQDSVVSQKSSENTKETKANTKNEDSGSNASNAVAATTATAAASTATSGGSGGGDELIFHKEIFPLVDNIQRAVDDTLKYYSKTAKKRAWFSDSFESELKADSYVRLRDIKAFMDLPDSEIRGSG